MRPGAPSPESPHRRTLKYLFTCFSNVYDKSNVLGARHSRRDAPDGALCLPSRIIEQTTMNNTHFNGLNSIQRLFCVHQVPMAILGLLKRLFVCFFFLARYFMQP